MNKKIKLSLISSLVTISSIGIILPIASCSSSSNLGKININQDMSKKDALALAIAKIGNSTATNTNGNINLNQFNNLTKEYTSSDATIWIALGNFFTFDSGFSFTDVVEKATVSGTFPQIGSEIKVKIVLNLKSGYIASDSGKLTLSDLKIGLATSNELTVTHSNDPSVKDALALAIAKAANSSATNTNGNINLKQFDIITREYNLNDATVWTALGNFFIFDSGISFNDVVKKATISGTFPEIGSEVKVKIVLILKNGYVATDISKLTLSDLKIGVAANYPTDSAVNVIISKDPKAKEELGLALAKIANPSATSINDSLTIEQYNKIMHGTYTLNNKMLWNAVKNYFIIDSGHIFDDCFEKIIFACYPFSVGTKVIAACSLVSKEGIKINSSSTTIVNDIIIGTAI